MSMGFRTIDRYRSPHHDGTVGKAQRNMAEARRRFETGLDLNRLKARYNLAIRLQEIIRAVPDEMILPKAYLHELLGRVRSANTLQQFRELANEARNVRTFQEMLLTLPVRDRSKYLPLVASLVIVVSFLAGCGEAQSAQPPPAITVEVNPTATQEPAVEQQPSPEVVATATVTPETTNADGSPVEQDQHTLVNAITHKLEQLGIINPESVRATIYYSNSGSEVVFEVLVAEKAKDGSIKGLPVGSLLVVNTSENPDIDALTSADVLTLTVDGALAISLHGLPDDVVARVIAGLGDLDGWRPTYRGGRAEVKTGDGKLVAFADESTGQTWRPGEVLVDAVGQVGGGWQFDPETETWAGGLGTGGPEATVDAPEATDTPAPATATEKPPTATPVAPTATSQPEPTQVPATEKDIFKLVAEKTSELSAERIEQLKGSWFGVDQDPNFGQCLKTRLVGLIIDKNVTYKFETADGHSIEALGLYIAIWNKDRSVFEPVFVALTGTVDGQSPPARKVGIINTSGVGEIYDIDQAMSVLQNGDTATFTSYLDFLDPDQVEKYNNYVLANADQGSKSSLEVAILMLKAFASHPNGGNSLNIPGSGRTNGTSIPAIYSLTLKM